MSRFLICLSTLLLLSPGECLGDQTLLPFERVSVSVAMDMGDWVIGHEKVLTGLTIIEWVPKGETVESWSSQFRVLRYANELMASNDARELAQQFTESLSHRCANPASLRHEILEANRSSALISWKLTDCESDDPYGFDQKELTRFIVGDEFTFNLALTQKLELDQESESAKTLMSEEDQIAVLKSASVHASGPKLDSSLIVQELMSVPAYRVYALFDVTNESSGRVWLKEVKREGSGLSTQVTYRLESTGLPGSHWYAAYMVKQPEGLTIPMQSGLKPNQNGELACPPSVESMPPVDSVTGADFATSAFARVFPCEENTDRSFNDIHSMSVGGFQKGLATAVGIQSHDASHFYLARAIPRPIRAQEDDCRIELELASPDGRTYLAWGSGFVPGEILETHWRYAKNKQNLNIMVMSDGRFTYPLFHTGKAKGSGKWNAGFQVKGSHCELRVDYHWGKKAMRG